MCIPTTDIWRSIKVKKNGNIGLHVNKMIFGTKKVMTNIASGPRYKEEKTWSEILIDKGEPVATLTHFYWAAMNWEGNSSTLRTLLVNIVYHYQNDHKRCHLALSRLSHISLEI